LAILHDRRVAGAGARSAGSTASPVEKICGRKCRPSVEPFSGSRDVVSQIMGVQSRSMTRSIMNKPFAIVLASFLTALSALAVPAYAQAKRPNIVVILGDDLGYADIGAFGSEINTPNIDALARDGVRFTNFYTHASCSPTRSLLLSGVDTHRNGLGNMDEWTAPNQRGVPGYEGLPEQAGHDAAAAAQGRGLPHLHGRQVAPGQVARPDPAARGFERDFYAARRRGQLLGHDRTSPPCVPEVRSSPRTGAT
jgi:hypothetical protein